MNRRGSALLEGALATLATLFFVIGIIDFSLANFAYSQLQYVAGEGARYASLRGATSSSPATTTSLSTYVRGLLIGINGSLATVTTTWTPNNSPGGTVTVRVDYTYAPLLVPTLGSGMNLRGTSSATVLQ